MKEQFKYRAGEDGKACKEVLENLAAKRYTAELYKARRNCLDKFGWDTRSWKTMVPHWCTTPKYWEELCDIFATEEFKSLSEQNKINRCASGLTVCHFGGSASAYQHTQNLVNITYNPHTELTFGH
jgi:phosphoglucomutase